MKAVFPILMGLLVIIMQPFTGCKKEPVPEPEKHTPLTTDLAAGMPPDPKRINGYLYMCQKVFRNGSSYYSQLIMTAGFGDPSRNLMAGYNYVTDQPVIVTDPEHRRNVSVGRVTCNSAVMGNANNINYTYIQQLDTLLFRENADWGIEGNGSFVPFKLRLPRATPEVISSSHDFSLQISAGYTLDVSDLLINFDSAGVLFSYPNSFPPVYKSIVNPGTVVTFSPGELSYLINRTFCNVTVMGFNYCHKTIEDKIYVFESAAKLERFMTIKP
jgi:hypothetical protein